MPRPYLPKQVPKGFLEDVVKFQRLYYGNDHPVGVVYGLEHQQAMRERWKPTWMQWVYRNVGKFENL